MKFAVVLAGGTGSRMGKQDRPKQYLMLGGRPIIAHTVEKFLVVDEFEKVIVLCPEPWVETTKDILRSHFGDCERISVVKGGDTRNDTIANAISFIEENYGIDDDSVICTHDAVRPFVTYRIIRENLDAMECCDACDTVIPSADTVVMSEDGKRLSSIPDRSKMYLGQTPQTFKVAVLKDLQDSLTADELASLTDACRIFALRNKEVALVRGETFNIKVTYPSDLKMAQALLGMGE